MAYRRSYRRSSRRGYGGRSYGRSSRVAMGRRGYGRSSAKRFSRRRVGFSDVYGGRIDSVGYVNKRFNPRAQNRMNWTASNAATHYRSVNGLAQGLTAPAASLSQAIGFLPFLDSSFWTLAGGCTSDITLEDDARLFLRGGISELRVTNADTVDAVTLRVWCIRTKDNGNINVTATPTNAFDIASVQDIMWDPTIQTDWFKFWKLWKSYEVIIKPGDTWSVKRKVLSQRIDLTQYNALAKRDFYVIGVSTGTSATGSVLWNTSFNVSFSADVIAGA